MVFLVVGILFALIVFVFIFLYNTLVQLNKRIDGAWAQIDVQLKRRYDLIPNLVETVKGYAKHEKELFENVTKARAAVASAGGPAEKAKADNLLTGALKTLFAVAENYPQLQANENFKMLQEELAGTENKIAFSRQFYNDNVLEFNTKIHLIPYNFIAGMLGYKEREYFRVEAAAEREPVKVKF